MSDTDNNTIRSGQSIPRNSDRGFVSIGGEQETKPKGDLFDQFLEATGGAPAPRSGHPSAVARLEKELSNPSPESKAGFGDPPEKSFASGQKGLTAATDPKNRF